MGNPGQFLIDQGKHIKSQVPPGTVFDARKNKKTGTVIEAVRRMDSLFVAICTEHGYSSRPGRDRIDAERSLRHPQGWCEGCKRILGVKEVEGPKPPPETPLCELCKVQKTTVTEYGHARSDVKILLCPSCRKSDEGKALYQDRFGHLVTEQQAEWKGMSKKRRAWMRKRMANTWQAEHQIGPVDTEEGEEAS